MEITPNEQFYENFSSSVTIGENFLKRFHKVLFEEYYINYLKNHNLYHSTLYRLVLKIREKYPIVTERNPYRKDDTIISQLMSLPHRNKELVEKMESMNQYIKNLTEKSFSEYFHFEKKDLSNVVYAFIQNLYWFKMFNLDVKKDKVKVFSVLSKLTYDTVSFTQTKKYCQFLHLCGGKQNKNSSLFKMILYLDSNLKWELKTHIHSKPKPKPKLKAKSNTDSKSKLKPKPKAKPNTNSKSKLEDRELVAKNLILLSML